MTSVSIPVTCKQLNNLIPLDGGVGIGNYLLNTVHVIAMIVGLEDSQSGSPAKDISVEDSTGMLTKIQITDDSLDDSIQFKYFRLCLSIATDNDSSPSFYLKHLTEVNNLQQVIEHQVKAYSFYLGNMVPETPHPTYKQHLLEKSAQPQHQASNFNNLAGGVGIDFNSSNPSFNSNQALFNPNQSGPISDRISAWLDAKGLDSFVLNDVAREFRLNEKDAKAACDALIDCGKLYTGADETEFHRV